MFYFWQSNSLHWT